MIFLLNLSATIPKKYQSSFVSVHASHTCLYRYDRVEYEFESYVNVCLRVSTTQLVTLNKKKVKTSFGSNQSPLNLRFFPFFTPLPIFLK